MRKATGLPGNYSVGDLVMYRRDQGAKQPGDEWQGPARTTGYDKNVPWMVHAGVPVAGAMHRIRPANTSEMLAYQVMSRSLTPLYEEVRPRAPGEQQRFLDLRPSPSEAVPPPAEDQNHAPHRSVAEAGPA